MIPMRQYAASPRIRQLINYHTEYFSATWVDEFYDVVWNIDTASGFGLDIWGRIVGLESGRRATINTTNYLGFKTEAVSQSWKPFGSGVFYDGGAFGGEFEFQDDAFRVVILAKAFSNISDMTIPSLNRMLQQIFAGRGRCYVRDIGDMQIQYVFGFPLASWERWIFQSAAVPGPGGVLVSIAVIPEDTFGFNEAGASSQTFNNGTLLSSGDL